MNIIVDANIVISAIIASDGKNQELLFVESLELFAPEFLFFEVYKHKKEIVKKADISDDEFETAISIISSRIKIIKQSEFKEFIKPAKEVCPDPNDVEYFALAMKLKCPFWSNEKKLKDEQDTVDVLNTGDMIRKINSN